MVQSREAVASTFGAVFRVEVVWCSLAFFRPVLSVVQRFEQYLQTFSETQLMWMIGAVMVAFLGMLIAACYYAGFADDVPERAQAGAGAAVAAAGAHAKSD